MKKFLALLFVVGICFCSVFFSSCSTNFSMPNPSITLSMALNKDGSVLQEVEFYMQSEKIEKQNVDSLMKTRVQENFRQALQTLRDEFYLTFLLVYSQNPDQRKQIGQALQISDAAIDIEHDRVFFDILYKDLSVWNYFHNVESQSDENKLLGSGSKLKYFQKISSSGDFPFSASFKLNNFTTMTVGERYYNIYNACLGAVLTSETIAKLDKPQFVYIYSTPFSSLKTNADFFIQAGGLYHNVWIEDLDSYKDSKIDISLTSINYSLWYLTLLIIVVFVLAIMLLFIKLKKL